MLLSTSNSDLVSFEKCMASSLVSTNVFCLPSDYRKDVPPPSKHNNYHLFKKWCITKKSLSSHTTYSQWQNHYTKLGLNKRNKELCVPSEYLRTISLLNKLQMDCRKTTCRFILHRVWKEHCSSKYIFFEKIHSICLADHYETYSLVPNMSFVSFLML